MNLINSKQQENRFLSSTSDDDDCSATRAQNTLLVGFIVLVILTTLFEINRQKRWIYHRRLTNKLKKAGRAPDPPKMYPFGWVVSVMNITDDDVLRMVGLDAYMFLRVQLLLLKTSFFFTLCGAVILIPTYSTAGGLKFWGKYTIANVPQNSSVLWVPTIVMYMFAFFVCRLFYIEYNEFFKRRISHYISGDPELPKQAHYTIMLENVPLGLRSVPKLKKLFEKLFPGKVYCVEVCLDLRELESKCAKRVVIRNKLEKAVAISNAYNVPHTVNLRKDYFTSFVRVDEKVNTIPLPVGKSSFWGLFGYDLYNAVEVYAMELDYLNKTVFDQQKLFYNKLLEQENIEDEPDDYSDLASAAIQNLIHEDINTEFLNLPKIFRTNSLTPQTSPEKGQGPKGLEVTEDILTRSSNEQKLLHHGTFVDQTLETLRETISKIDLAEKFIQKEMNAEEKYLGNTIGLFIPGTKVYMKFTGTAFITFNSRVTKVCCERALLSHRYFQMKATPAPNPKEIVWSNITLHSKVQKFRAFFANCILAIGAVGWALLAYTVTQYSTGLNAFSKQYKWIEEAQKITILRILFEYLFLLLLLLLMALLPLFFDAISRRYEGVKTETWIHESIMVRFFLYQLVYVLSTTSLSALTQANGCLSGSNCQVTSLIGQTLPTVSSFFVTLLVFKAFIQMPVCLIRGWPLLRIATVKFCCLFNRKKVTRREIRNGIFFDPPMLYGWYYPSILMVALILFVFSTIAPLLSPVACIFFIFTYIVYKHHLLYVYVDFYQAGGSMFTSVFNQIMTSLLISIICLLCYFTIQIGANIDSEFSDKKLPSAFYGLIPSVPLLVFFWHYLYSKFNDACSHESLDIALEFDKKTELEMLTGGVTHHMTFRKNLYRQRCLTEGAVRAEGYRSKVDSSRISDVRDASRRISDVDATKEYFNDDGSNSDSAETVKANAEAKWFDEVDFFDEEAEKLIHLEIDELLSVDSAPTSAISKLKSVGNKMRHSLAFIKKENDEENPREPLRKD